MHPDMESIRCSIVRGGTSKGIYILENQLPKDMSLRNKVIQNIFGSPDPRQIDGLGGADTLTSKLAIISASDRPDADVEYTFAQVGIEQDVVDYGGNCGNISSGVGPFAIEEGLVKAVEPVTTVRIYQTNTDKILIADVPVQAGKPCVDGDCMIDGVPGTGAKITMDFTSTIGSVTGKLLPTGNATDRIRVGGQDYEVSIVDAGNPLVFIAAESLGLKGNESAAEIDRDKELLKTIECIRGQAAAVIGLVQHPEEATALTPYNPFFAIVSAPQAYTTPTGKAIAAEEIDLVSRVLFMQKMHKTYPGTGAVCTAAAVRIPGSIANKMLSRAADSRECIRIGHPAGVMEVVSKYTAQADTVRFDRLAFFRTARILMTGCVNVKKSIFNSGK